MEVLFPNISFYPVILCNFFSDSLDFFDRHLDDFKDDFSDMRLF